MSKYNYLNLNQKMIKIRKKIPSLIRKRYSEDVDYDFVKLDDINQFLTPALNRYGVDFDILREIPTRADEHGKAIFLTKEGNLWIYEADLEICWTNADHPEEKSISILHLVGMNDAADKAKGTAMTYGLKYYLLNKFNISQNGNEDPDMRGSKSKEENGETPDKAGEKETTKSLDKKSLTGYEPDKSLDEEMKTSAKPVAQESSVKKSSRNGNAISSGEEIKTPAVEEQSKAAKPVLKEASKMEEEAVHQYSFSDIEDDSGIAVEKPEHTMEQEVSVEAEESSFQEERDEPEEEAEDFMDEFEAVTEEDEVPFTDSEVENDTEEAEDAYSIQEGEEVEKAKAVICNFGFFKGKTLGEMLETQKGWESLKWIAARYKGANQEMKEAAQVLVDAGMYEPKVA